MVILFVVVIGLVLAWCAFRCFRRKRILRGILICVCVELLVGTMFSVSSRRTALSDPTPDSGKTLIIQQDTSSDERSIEQVRKTLIDVLDDEGGSFAMAPADSWPGE